jgi:hypothetical protein
MFVGLAVSAQTAQAEEALVVPVLDILTMQSVHSGYDWLFPFRIKAGVVLTTSEYTDAVGVGFSDTSQLHLVTMPKNEIIWLANSRVKMTPNSNAVSIFPILRFESKGEQIEIKPGRRSFSIEWRKALP